MQIRLNNQITNCYEHIVNSLQEILKLMFFYCIEEKVPYQQYEFPFNEYFNYKYYNDPAINVSNK